MTVTLYETGCAKFIMMGAEARLPEDRLLRRRMASPCRLERHFSSKIVWRVHILFEFTMGLALNSLD